MQRSVAQRERSSRDKPGRRRDPVMAVPVEGPELRAGMVLRAESGFYTVGPLPPSLATALAGAEHPSEEEGGPPRTWGALNVHPSLVLACPGLDHTVRCTLPGRLRRGERTATNPLSIGDCVAVRTLGEEEGTVEGRAARHSELARQAAGDTGQKHVLAANLDLLVIVVALREPPPNLARLDRFLVVAEQASTRAAICVNKADQGEPGEAEALFALYPPLGYQVIVTSAATGAGIADLRAILGDGLSAVVGVSGVGKSRLLNVLQPGLALRYAGLSDSTGKGRHTTTTAELIPLTDGGYIADTPGLRAIAPWDTHPVDLALLFPEMRPLVGSCRFSTCSHRHEPGCAILEALAAGYIAPGRYESYVKLFDEAVQEQAARYR